MNLLQKGLILSAKSKNNKFHVGKSLTALLFILPAIVLTIVFRYYPFFKAMSMSVMEYPNVLTPGKFVFLDNFITVVSTSLFWISLKNIIIIWMMGICIGFWVPILQALCINELVKGQRLAKFFYIIPIAIPAVAGYLIWRWIFLPDAYGGLNSLFGLIGLGPFGWLNDTGLVKLSLALPGLQGGGMGVFLYLSAILGISSEVYEAAKLDGCVGILKWRYITLPNISFIIGIQFLFSIIGGLQAFDQQFVMTGGGPNNASLVPGIVIYDYAFHQWKFGLATALSVVLFLIIFMFTLIQLRMTKMHQN